MFVSDGHGRADNAIHRIFSINSANYWSWLSVCFVEIVLDNNEERKRRTEIKRRET